MAIVLSSAALTELALAQLDAYRERKGVDVCERFVRTMRKSLERFPGKMSALTPAKIETASARKDALDALAERCLECGRCSAADG